MQEIRVNKNDGGQRIDRFLMKYLSKAPRTFIFKMLRKKNIKLNGKRADPEDEIKEGDNISLYLSDETIDKFRGEIRIKESSLKLDIEYEDENIIIINKPVGILSHGDGTGGENIVDGLINYLIRTGAYSPESEKTFTPSIANRLDRNTSGIIIGAKNYQALKDINESIRMGQVKRYYRTIVKGRAEEELLEGYLSKDEGENLVSIGSQEKLDSREIKTYIRPLIYKNGYTLLEIDLITGRPHQIRAHLRSINLPVIGDRKYGDLEINKFFERDYNLKSQYLHGYRVEFKELVGSLAYLSHREFKVEANSKFIEIEKTLFK